MLTAAWLDDIEGKDPTRQIVRATKALLDRVGEPVIRASVGQAMKIMGEHFVLGETIASAQWRARLYAERGYTFSYDMLGEAAYTAEDAEKYFNDYAAAIAAIGAEARAGSPEANPGISVKLSALHPRYEYAKKDRVLKELGAKAAILARAAKAANIGFNIDAEEAFRLDLSLDLIEQLARDPALAGWEGLGVVVQAYQRRARPVIDWLAAIARATDRRMMVRLVKGAYWDGEIKRAQVGGFASYPVFTRKVLTDLSYQACARKLFENADVFYPQFATHNALTAALVREMAGKVSAYELQRLHGMGEALHDRIVESGVRSRIYAPVGGYRELLPYLVRRLLENGANSSFVNQLFDPDLAIDRVVADPIDEALKLNVLPNPSIPAPRDQFGGTRLSAKGFDLNDPDTVSRLLKAASSRRDDKAAPIVSGRIIDGPARGVMSPADRRAWVGAVIEANAVHVDEAVAAAKAAQAGWAALGAKTRGDILRRAADILESRTEDYVARCVWEAGKTLADGIAEVREAVDFLRYYADQGEDLSGEPLGVVVCISPWNFPLAIFLGQVAGALAAGNAVVAKPAEQTPLIAFEAVRLMHEAGVPTAALQFLPGDGPTVGAPLTRHGLIGGVVFTGSTEVAQAINRALAARDDEPALIAETGGINAMIVDSTALLEQAVSDAISSAFQSAGQRCSAARIVCVQEDVADRFCAMLAGAMTELEIGDPARLSTDIGPVIDEAAKATIEAHSAEMRRQARLVAEVKSGDPSASGVFVPAVAFELKSISDLDREVFGPVLHVVRFRAGALGETLAAINASGFGLTLGLHSRIDEAMHETAAEARVGNIYINRNQIGAVVGVQPFGGEGLSGTGPKAGGPHYLKAMQKRPPAAGVRTITLLDGALDAASAEALNRAEKAFLEAAGLDRRHAFDRAAASAGPEAAECLRAARDLHSAEFADIDDLPGPAGESNTMKLRGRGVALVCGGAPECALALAAGNAIAAHGPLAAALEGAFAVAGLPALVVALPGERGSVPGALLDDARVRLVLADADAASTRAIKRRLAARPWAIAPLLSIADAPWRFAAERTLTVNTTAAGGDVRLLSLTE